METVPWSWMNLFDYKTSIPGDPFYSLFYDIPIMLFTIPNVNLDKDYSQWYL